MRRRILLILAVLLAGVIAVVATLPFWLGAAAGAIGRSRGLTFGAYERLGYSRFALRDVEFHRGTVRVTVSRAEAETPVVWLWHRWTHAPAEITAETWRVEVQRNPTPQPASPDRGWMQLRALLQRIAVKLDEWLPRARTGAGLVRWPGGEISLAGAKWADRQLTADGLTYRSLQANAVVSFPRGTDDLKLAARTTDAALVTTLTSRGTAVTGDFAVFDQPATLSASFAPRGWLPAEALVRAQNWNVAGERLRLGALYSVVRGSAQIEWRSEHFVADISAAGEPLPGKSAPPLELTLKGRGDAAAFTLESLRAQLPGVAAALSEPVTIERSGRLREGTARFALQADLAKQPWFSANGAVNGEARLVSAVTAAPEVEFSVAAERIETSGIALSSLALRGRFAWPRIEIASGTIAAGEGEQLAFHGGWDFREKEILDAAITGQIRRQSLARWLPKQPVFDRVKVDARGAGRLAEAKHEGRIEVADVKFDGLNPLALAARWDGQGTTVTRFDAEGSAASTKLIVAGSLDARRVELSRLDFAQGETPRLTLKAPATIAWKPQLQVSSLHLAGPAGNLTAAATWGEAGRVEVSAHEIPSEWFTDLVPQKGPPWRLTLFALVGAWDRGPMTMSLTAGATVDIGEGRMAAVTAAARGDKDGIRIEALRGSEGDATFVNASGQVPVTLTPAMKPLVHIDERGPLRLDATMAPNSAFWQKLATMTGVELQEPHAEAHLTGTWQRPEGTAMLKARRVAVDAKRITRPLPAIESLDVQLRAERTVVTLDRFSLLIEGQPLRAQGRLPVPDGEWAALIKNPLGLAQRGADLRIEVPEADVAVFTRFLPAVLAPKGRLQADLQYKDGGFEGYLKLRDAASRPLGPLGVLQEISADIALSGRKLALRGVTARSGGQPVTLTGTVELPPQGTPQFDLSLRGENLPFVRQTGLLVRGDLDLKLQTPQGAPPRLSGEVRLRDSLFLADVRAFLPKGGAASPSRRPPYFAVETPPVNSWTLAIDLTGDEFMRLRTPVFTGVASARFRLSGTLGEPRAIGQVTVNEGRVRMPFASFDVNQGIVRLTDADPFEPAIYLRGTARRWGYDIAMEIEGSASQPNVTFTSSPPLDSEQVLQMVMTGAAPSNEIAKSSTQRMASIGYFLGQSLLGSLGSDAADADRLSIASGEKISRQGKETYDIEYKLSDRWTLTGEYNEFDEYNAGVKWRILRGESGGGRKDHAKQ